MNTNIKPLIVAARDVASNLYRYADGIQGAVEELDNARLDMRCVYILLRQLKQMLKRSGHQARAVQLFTDVALDEALQTFRQCEEVLQKTKEALEPRLVELAGEATSHGDKRVPIECLGLLSTLQNELQGMSPQLEDIKKDLSLQVLVATLRLCSMGSISRFELSPFAEMEPDARLELAAYLWADKGVRTTNAGVGPNAPPPRPVTPPPRPCDDENAGLVTPSCRQPDAPRREKRDSSQSEAAVACEKQEVLHTLDIPFNLASLEDDDEKDDDEKDDDDDDDDDDDEDDDDDFYSATLDPVDDETIRRALEMPPTDIVIDCASTAALDIPTPTENYNDFRLYEPTYRALDRDRASSKLLFSRFPSSPTLPTWRMDEPRMRQMKSIPFTSIADIRHQITILRTNQSIQSESSSRHGAHAIERRRMELNLLKEQINVRIYKAMVLSTDLRKQAKTLVEAMQLHHMLAEVQESTLTEVMQRKSKRNPATELVRLIEEDKGAGWDVRLPHLEQVLENILLQDEYAKAVDQTGGIDDLVGSQSSSKDRAVALEESVAMRSWVAHLQDEVEEAKIGPVDSQTIVESLMEKWALQGRVDVDDVFFQSPVGWVQESSPTKQGELSKLDPMMDYDGGFQCSGLVGLAQH